MLCSVLIFKVYLVIISNQDVYFYESNIDDKFSVTSLQTFYVRFSRPDKLST